MAQFICRMPYGPVSKYFREHGFKLYSSLSKITFGVEVCVLEFGQYENAEDKLAVED